MINESTITICGKEVRMRYCAAAETGYEQLSGKGIEVFTPTFGKDDEGNTIVKEKPAAMMQDYLYLATAAIVAAYLREGTEAPISAKDILYDTTPQEVTELITLVVRLRNEWYKVPEVVKPEMEEREDDGKNVQPPTTDSKK